MTTKRFNRLHTVPDILPHMTRTNQGICNTGNRLKSVVLRKSAIKNKINIKVISVQGCLCNVSSVPPPQLLPATAASRFGLNKEAVGLRGAVSLLTFSLSQDSSKGKRCWIGRSRCDRPARNLAPQTI